MNRERERQHTMQREKYSRLQRTGPEVHGKKRGEHARAFEALENGGGKDEDESEGHEEAVRL